VDVPPAQPGELQAKQIACAGESRLWITCDAGVLASADGGATFGKPVRVDGGGALGRVDVELLPDGSAVILWIALDQGKAELLARRIFADGRRGPSAAVARVSSDRSSGHARVIRSGNQLYFTWREPAPSSRVLAAVAGVPEDAVR